MSYHRRLEVTTDYMNGPELSRRGSRGKLAGKSVFLQIIGNDNANISVFFSTTYLLIPAISKLKSRHHNILQVCKKRLSNFLKSQPTCPCAGASWLPAWGKMVANTDYTHKSYLK